MAGPTSATRTSSSPWAAIPLRTTRSGSASSWKRGATATRSWCAVDPRFNRTAAVADRFVQIRAGTDIAFLGGLINYVLTRNRYHDEYVRLFTNAPFLVSEQYAFDEKRGVFAGWDDEKKTYADKSSWNYELDEQGFAKVDPTLAHPRSVFQVMKRFYSRYTPDTVSTICGCSADDFVKAADLITSTHTPDRVGTILYALGWTHHSHSVQLIHAAAMLQLLLGNIGRPGGGLNALRGHANIQGGTDCGMAYHNLPGYIAIPKADHASLASFIGAVTPKPLRPNSTNFWANTDRFVVSQLKAYYGAAATPENEFGYAMASQAAAVGAGRLRELELGLHLRSHVSRRHGRVLQLRDEPGQQRPALAQGDRRAREVEVDGRRGELRAGDGVVLAPRHPRARRSEAGGRADGGVPAARGQLRREGRQLRELGAVDPVEVEGRGSAGRGPRRSGDRRAHLPEGARALSSRKAAPTRIRSAT